MAGCEPGSDCRRRGCRHSTRAHRANAHSPSPSGTGCRAGNRRDRRAGQRPPDRARHHRLDGPRVHEFGLDPDLKARGRALDDRLARLQELWRQWGAPEIPLWCGGRWPRKPGLRRAARFDGVLLTFAGQRNSTVPVETFADAVGFVRGLTGDRPFDIAVEGATELGTAAGHIAPYVAAGATWWVEAMGWWRGRLATSRDRITAGPPA